MAKIAEVLDIQRSYSTQVELRDEYFDLDSRYERMSHYKPIKAHRSAFEKITQGMWQQNNKRSYILSGSFGTGKSHLLMMAASYFSTPSSAPEMKQFFENYELAEREEHVQNPKASQLKNLRSEGQYLVSICDYASPDFETNLLKAIRETLTKKNFDVDSMESAYKQAVWKIKEWKNSDNQYFINKMEALLEEEGSQWFVDSLVSGLEQFDVDALAKFKLLHKQITSTDFQYDKDNYIEVIADLVKTPAIKDKYKGWVILFDEFDYQVGEKRFRLEQFQRFLQMCSKSLLDGFPVMFIATIHKSFLEYRSVYNAADFSTISDRLEEIKLESEGIEDIIAAVVNPRKDSEAWKNEIAAQQSRIVQLANDTNKYHLFEWLRAPQIKGKIIENIYPMHPVATYSLIKLSGAAGSNNRSVVTFFADESEEIGSYAQFINHSDISENGDLNLYTADMLCDYFALSSTSENVTDVAKEYIRNYETSLRELSRIRHNDLMDLSLLDSIFERILKLMVVYDIIGLANTKELLGFGLDMNTQAKQASLAHSLDIAVGKKIIYLNDTNGCYEFKRSDSKDISGLIRDYKSKTANVPDNYILTLESVLGSELAKKTKKQYRSEALEPRKYDLTYLEDKRLKRIFCMFKDMEATDFFENIHNNLLSETDIKKSDDGAIIHVICETQEELTKAAALTRNNKFPEIMVAVPNEPAAICDDIFSLKASCYYNENAADFSSQDRMALKDQGQAYDTRVAKRLEFIMDSKNYMAYAAYGEMLENGQDDVGAAALLERMYKGKRNTFKHVDLNKTHDFKENNTALRDAADRLLDMSQSLSYHNDYGNDRGDIKYLKTVLVQNGVIYVSNSQGAIQYCSVQNNVDTYKKTMPALYAMITEIKGSQGTEISIQPFVKKYIREYGIGYNAVLLYMAVVKRYFADSLSVMKDVTAIGTVNVNNMDVLKSVVMSSGYAGSVMRYEPISEDEKTYINRLGEVFGGNGLENLNGIQHLVVAWYSSLPSICKVPEMYSDELTGIFVRACNRLNSASIREICLYDFKEAAGMDRDVLIYGSIGDAIVKEIRKQKETVENGFFIAKQNVIQGVCGIFDVPTNRIEDAESAFNNWKSGLDEAQRDVMNPLQSEESKPLARAVNREIPFTDQILVEIPSDMRFGKVESWTSDLTQEYISLFELGKKHIENEVYAVSCPKYRLDGNYLEADGQGRTKEIRFVGELNITLDNGDGNICYYVTTDGSNPTDIAAQRMKRVGAYFLNIKKNAEIRLCGMSDNGKYSSVITLQCVNEDTKYEVKANAMQQFDRIELNGLAPVSDYKVSGVLPVDADSLTLCVDSIVNLMKQYHEVGNAEIVKGLQNALDKLEE